MTSNLDLELILSARRIRCVEEEIARRYPEGNMRCPTHLSIGQEIVASAAGLFMRDVDFAVSTHRAHAHYLAKGGSLRAMLGEIYGQEFGCSKGRGGSMHLADASIGFMGSSAIVGNSIPIGVGLGKVAKMTSDKNVSVVFFGEGATEEGVFYESLNLAATLELPVIFICENNGLSVYSDMSPRQPLSRDNIKIANAMGVKGVRGDSSELDNLMPPMQQAFEYCRNTRSPIFLEVTTTRYLEHCGPNRDDHLGYRDLEQLRKAEENDLLDKLEREMMSKGKISSKEVTRIRESVIAEFDSVEEDLVKL